MVLALEQSKRLATVSPPRLYLATPTSGAVSSTKLPLFVSSSSSWIHFTYIKGHHCTLNLLDHHHPSASYHTSYTYNTREGIQALWKWLVSWCIDILRGGLHFSKRRNNPVPHRPGLAGPFAYQDFNIDLDRFSDVVVIVDGFSGNIEC